MYHSISHRKHSSTSGGRQVDAVMEVPTISIDTWSEGCIHLVWCGTLAKGPDEVGGEVSAGTYFVKKVVCLVCHLSSPLMKTPILGRSNNSHSSISAQILERTVFHIQNSRTSDFLGRRGRHCRIRNYNDALSASEFF